MLTIAAFEPLGETTAATLWGRSRESTAWRASFSGCGRIGLTGLRVGGACLDLCFARFFRCRRTSTCRVVLGAVVLREPEFGWFVRSGAAAGRSRTTGFVRLGLTRDGARCFGAVDRSFGCGVFTTVGRTGAGSGVSAGSGAGSVTAGVVSAGSVGIVGTGSSARASEQGGASNAAQPMASRRSSLGTRGERRASERTDHRFRPVLDAQSLRSAAGIQSPPIPPSLSLEQTSESSGPSAKGSRSPRRVNAGDVVERGHIGFRRTSASTVPSPRRYET
jgi:hypothetical protein